MYIFVLIVIMKDTMFFTCLIARNIYNCNLPDFVSLGKITSDFYKKVFCSQNYITPNESHISVTMDRSTIHAKNYQISF